MTTSEVFGRPIEGEIRPTNDHQRKQADPMELIKALDELLAIPGVIEFKWTQYTEYWNDGEPVEFNTYIDWNAGVKLEFGLDDGSEMGDGYYTSFNLSSQTQLNGTDITQLSYWLSEVSHAIGNGSHYDWLKDTFGDHATIIANKEGFKVEFYEHD